MKKKYCILSIIVLMFCVFSCKNEVHNEPHDVDYSSLPTEEGFFIDAPTCGLKYKTYPSGMCGVTDRNGRFCYKRGDEVTFFVGNMQLGYSIPCRRCISPLYIAGAATIYGSLESTILAQNIIRFLMALNTRTNPYGLIIPVTDRIYNYDLYAILCSPYFERDIIEIIAALRDMLPAEIVLPTIEEAQKHFLISESLINQLEEKADKNLYLSIKVPASFKNHYIDFAFNTDTFDNPYFSGKKILVDNNCITKYSTKIHEANWQLTLTALQQNSGISKNDLISFYTSKGFSNVMPEGYPLKSDAEMNLLHADLSEHAKVIEEIFIQNFTLVIPKFFSDDSSVDMSHETPVYLYLDLLNENTNSTAASIELIIPVSKEQYVENENTYTIPFTTTLAKGFTYKSQVYYKPDSSKKYYVKASQRIKEETGDVSYSFTSWDKE